MMQRRPFASIHAATAGVSLIEFALAAPLLLSLGLVGLEVANLALANLRISQMASTTADNASRGSTAITENDIYQLLFGALNAASQMSFQDNGKIIVSSIERNSTDNGYWIRWQRCAGTASVTSKYGTGGDYDYNKSTSSPGTGYKTSTLQSFGTAPNTITPSPNNAMILVEVTYAYQPLVNTALLGPRNIRYEAAMVVRQRSDFSIKAGTLPVASRNMC